MASWKAGCRRGYFNCCDHKSRARIAHLLTFSLAHAEVLEQELVHLSLIEAAKLVRLDAVVTRGHSCRAWHIYPRRSPKSSRSEIITSTRAVPVQLGTFAPSHHLQAPKLVTSICRSVTSRRKIVGPKCRFLSRTRFRSRTGAAVLRSPSSGSTRDRAPPSTHQRPQAPHSHSHSAPPYYRRTSATGGPKNNLSYIVPYI